MAFVQLLAEHLDCTGGTLVLRITPAENHWFRLYPRHYADRKDNSTPEIFGPKVMECTIGGIDYLPD